MLLVSVLALGWLFLPPVPCRSQVIEQWIIQADSISARGIAVDRDENVYVIGGIFRGTSGFNMVLIKYDPAGHQQWMSEYNGVGDDLDDPTAIALDTLGNVFVTGYSYRGPGAQDFEIITIKYGPNGDSLWSRRYNGLSSRDDRAFAIGVDSSGNSYVAGFVNGILVSGDAGRDYITIKYGPDGTQVWASRLDLESCSDYKGLVVVPSGEVYVAGTGVILGSTSSEYITVKYTTSGASSWVRRYDGPGNGYDDAKGIALDDSGNVYVTGRSTGSRSFDYATVKYSGNGDLQWVRRHDGPADAEDSPIGMVIDRQQGVYVTGTTTVSGSFLLKDFLTIKYNGAGDVLWLRQYDGPGPDIPVGIIADSAGSIYITGSTYAMNGYNDYATIKYGANGDSLWFRLYNAADLIDDPVAIALDESGNVYVTGRSDVSYTSSGAGTIKYSQSLTDVRDESGANPNEFNLSQNYPNPFNPTTRISYQVAVATDVRLAVYDLLGREVALLVNERKAQGSYEAMFDAVGLPSGVYLYSLNAGAQRYTKKMIVLK